MTIIRKHLKYHRDEPFISNGAISDVPHDHDNASFKYKQKITGQTEDNGRKKLKEWYH